MKIENIGQIKGIEQVYVFGQSAVKITGGEILVARIEQIQGEKVLLRNKEGALFMALMQGELGLAEGDVVEVAASENKGGYLLHLLDINKELPGTAARQGAGDTIPGAMAMMKANPGLDPKSAAFLIENSIPDNTGNLSALSDIVRGSSGLGTLLSGILLGLNQADEASSQAVHDLAQSALRGTQASQADGLRQHAPETNTVNPDLSARASDGQRGAAAAVLSETAAGVQQGPSAPPQQDAMAPAQPGAAVSHPKSAGLQPGMPQMSEAHDATRLQAAENNMPPGSAQGSAAEGQTTAAQYQVRQAAVGMQAPFSDMAASKEHASRSDPAHYNKEQIEEKIREIFVRLDQTGVQIKKTVKDAPDNISALKMMLENSDINNKNILLQRADQADKQLELMYSTKRFEYIQIPFMLKNGAERTAQLYVYRRKRSRQTGEEGISVLVSLDTKNIGRVETLIKADGSAISLEFRLERKEIQQDISRRAKALAKALEAAGYRLKSVRIKGLETKTTVINAAPPEEDAAIRSGNLDVKI